VRIVLKVGWEIICREAVASEKEIYGKRRKTFH